MHLKVWQDNDNGNYLDPLKFQKTYMFWHPKSVCDLKYKIRKPVTGESGRDIDILNKVNIVSVLNYLKKYMRVWILTLADTEIFVLRLEVETIICDAWGHQKRIGARDHAVYITNLWRKQMCRGIEIVTSRCFPSTAILAQFLHTTLILMVNFKIKLKLIYIDRFYYSLIMYNLTFSS